MDGIIRGSSESYIPILVTRRKNPIAVTCVGITRIAIIKVNAIFFNLKSYAYSPYAVSAEKYVQIAAEQPETIRLFKIPLSIGKVPSFATLIKFFIKWLPGSAENPFCKSACERVELTINI